MREPARNRFPRRHLGQTKQADAIVFADSIVVRLVAKGEREQALFLQIGFVNTREAARDHGRAAQ